MNEDVVADLKQFIAATISQQLALQTQELTARIDGVESQLRDQDEVLNEIQNAIGERFEEHHQRLTRLEKLAAQVV